MISEKQICELFSSLLPSGRDNACFESDAEMIQLAGIPNGLFTTDEFSAEDLFAEHVPYLLGWNIAAGAISDVLACGGTPLYYAHALTVAPRWDAEYLQRFAMGVRDVLHATGARFIGGDCGRSVTWRCTASVIGSCTGTPVRRRGAAAGDLIYLSGEVGAGNLQAALRLHPQAEADFATKVRTQFPLRIRESAVMRKFATCCIDTSDGLCAALNTVAELNGCGYEVWHLPYLKAAVAFCAHVSLPKTLLALGECGEYELMLTVRPDREAEFLAAAQNAGCRFYRIGQITSSSRELNDNGCVLDLGGWQSQARSFGSLEQYLAELISWLRRQEVGTARCAVPARVQRAEAKTT